MSGQIKKVLSLLLVFLMIFSPIVQAMDIIIEDPTPDTTPPLIKELMPSVEKEVSPTQSQTFRIKITDDLSGVKSVYVYFQHESGALVLVPIKTLADDLFEGTFSVNKYGKSGEWKLYSVNVTDKKENNTTYYSMDTGYSQVFDFSSIIYLVSGTEEQPTSEPPVLQSMAISTFSEDNTASPLEPATFTVKVSDDNLDDSSVSVRVRSSSGRTYSTSLTYNPTTQIHSGKFHVSQYGSLGEWVVESITMFDGFNNITAYNSRLGLNQEKEFTFENDRFNVVGTTPDFVLPSLDTLERSLIQVSSKKAIFRLGATFSDNLSGVSYASVGYLRPNKSRFSVPFVKGIDGKYFAEIPIDQYDQLGKWELEYISVGDRNSNSSSIYNSAIAPYAPISKDFSAYSFTVRGLITIEPVVPFGIDTNFTKIELVPGERKSLKTKLTYSDGNYKDVSATSTGTTYYSNTEKLRVEMDGTIVASSDIIPGEYYIDVKHGAFYKQIKVLIPGEFSKNNRLIVSPSNLSLPKGSAHRLSISAEIDGNLYDISGAGNGVTYVNEYPQLVSVDSNGLVKNLTDAILTTKLEVHYKDLKTTVEIKLDGPPKIEEIISSPSEIELYRGTNIQINSRALFSDGSSENITNSLNTTYTSSIASRVAVDENGLIKVPLDASYGYSTITVKNGANFSKVLVKVIEDLSNVMFGIEAVGPDSIMYHEDTYQLEVMGTYPTYQKNITSSKEGTTYVSSVPSRVSVDAEGLLTIPAGATYGDATITVKNGTFVQKLAVTVAEDTSKVLGGIEVTGPGTSLERGATHQLEVTGAYPAGQKDITSSTEGTTYVSTVPSRVSVDAEGLLTVPVGAVYGDATITVKNGTFVQKLTVTVAEDTSKVLGGIEVTGPGTSLERGATHQLEVTGAYPAGQKDITSSTEGTTYVSTVPSRVSVDAEGLLTVPVGAVYGDATITVKNGTFVQKLTVTVAEDTSKVLGGIEVTGPGTSLERGATHQLEVTGTYPTGQKDITSSAEGTTYVSSVPSRVSVDAEGLLTVPMGASYGTAIITVKNGVMSYKITVTVSENPYNVLQELLVTDFAIYLRRGETYSLSVEGVYLLRTEDLTLGSTGTTYLSSVPNRVIVNTNGILSVPSSASIGSSVITVKNGKKYVKKTIQIIN
ncbi:hypothetical protein EVJ30_11045 [Exiguobacterium sp. SH5S13]|uniref:DUF7743 domain-containing protein n=1 Tax=Exiguobacterium sp. SH5S13 TaxID=2510959 RepID=UPI00103C72BD|nr:hypothetical protein [Exiguobacterium sp. SH5S13]TCI51395.1 hypothetical protein EVJ30_11045 [Exiguobacterium sp. SH5S13]